jgi:hypothetical protein
MEDEDGAFTDGIEKLTDIFTAMAEKLDDLAEFLGTSDDELTEQFTASLINAMDSISAIVNGAAEKVMEISSELFDDNELAEKALECNT